MFLLICKLYICIQNVFGHIFYSTRLHLYQQVWQFEVQKLAYMLILAAGGMIPYLSSVPPRPGCTWRGANEDANCDFRNEKEEVVLVRWPTLKIAFH